MSKTPLLSQAETKSGKALFGTAINKFYEQSSVLPANKYFVGLWGDYVEGAINMMRHKSEKNGVHSYFNSMFGDFLSRHVSTKNQIDLDWTVEAVKVPTVQTKTVTDFNIDAVKSINYPLIVNHNGTGIVSLNIVEDKQMMLYHFFNSLMNNFFNPTVLKPRSSFQKMGIFVIVMNGVDITTSTQQTKGRVKVTQSHDAAPLQIFEFNSAVIKNVGDISLTQDLPAKLIRYTVTFEVPNLFQSSFKTTFKGLRDITTDGKFLRGITSGDGSKSLLRNKGETIYDVKAFES